MTEIAPTTVYDYTPQQAEVVRLADRYRRCLMDQKYYARRLALYQRWDIATNLFAGFAMLLSLATRNSISWIANASYAVGALAAIIFIGKPILRVSEQIEKYTILHCGFGEVFSRIEALMADIRRADSVTDEHRQRAEELFKRCESLALREDASVNWKQLARIKEEVDKAIPFDTLWLPSK